MVKNEKANKTQTPRQVLRQKNVTLPYNLYISPLFKPQVADQQQKKTPDMSYAKRNLPT